MSDEGMTPMSDEGLALMRRTTEDALANGTEIRTSGAAWAVIIARLDAAERERDALREALAKIANYDRKHKTPQRDGRMADTTHLYLQGFARAALTANHSAPVVEE